MIKRVNFTVITVKENGRSKSYMIFKREGIQLRLPFSFYSHHLNIYMLMMLGDEVQLATYIKEISDGHHAEESNRTNGHHDSELSELPDRVAEQGSVQPPHPA